MAFIRVVDYQVVKPFTYDGREYKPGEAWQPGGTRRDAQIVAARYVRAIERMMELEPEAPPRKGRVKEGDE